MSALTLRPAVVADLPAILVLLADDPLGRDRDDPAAADHPDYRAAFDAIAADPNRDLMVAERDGAIVGTLTLSLLRGLSRRGALTASFEDVRIAAPLRGGGLGTAMITQAIALCRARGCVAISLKSHRSRSAAHRFYARLGFAHSHVAIRLEL